VRQFFINEWIITDQPLSRKEAREKLRKALKASVKKAKKMQKDKED